MASPRLFLLDYGGPFLPGFLFSLHLKWAEKEEIKKETK